MRNNRFRTWEIMFPCKCKKYTCRCQHACPYCGSINQISWTKYNSGKLDRAHILPAVWGGFDDKFWWNCIPTCCNKQQPKRPRYLVKEEDQRVEHMLIALVKTGRQEQCRRIVYQMFKGLLKENDLAPYRPPTIGWSHA